jgi:kynureninase
MVKAAGGLLREHFPILQSKTYLASHSMGAVPAQTAEALAQYFHDWASLGIEAWEGPFWQAVTDFQDSLGGLLGWPPGSVCPLQNATRAMAALASGFSYRGERRRILLGELEFTTAFPFWLAQQELGAEVVVIGSPDGRTLPLEAFQAELDERTLLVVCSHAFFRSGQLCPHPRELSAAVHAVGGRLLLDAYQTLGAVPLKAAEWGVDAVVGGCHKWLCGGPGAGYLAIAPDYWPELRPRLAGWFGLKAPFSYQRDLGRGDPAESALRFLGGTPNVPALYACRPALRLIAELGIDRIRQTSIAMTEMLRGLLEQRGLEVLSPGDPSRRNGMLCLSPPAGAGGEEVVAELSRQGILVDYRPDCGIRVSPHFYSNADDLERFVGALAERL